MPRHDLPTITCNIHGCLFDSLVDTGASELRQITSLAELQSYLGLTGYYREFVPVHAVLCATLYRLTNVDTPLNA